MIRWEAAALSPALADASALAASASESPLRAICARLGEEHADKLADQWNEWAGALHDEIRAHLLALTTEQGEVRKAAVRQIPAEHRSSLAFGMLVRSEIDWMRRMPYQAANFLRCASDLDPLSVPIVSHAVVWSRDRFFRSRGVVTDAPETVMHLTQSVLHVMTRHHEAVLRRGKGGSLGKILAGDGSFVHRDHVWLDSLVESSNLALKFARIHRREGNGLDDIWYRRATGYGWMTAATCGFSRRDTAALASYLLNPKEVGQTYSEQLHGGALGVAWAHAHFEEPDKARPIATSILRVSSNKRHQNDAEELLRVATQ